MRGVLRRDRQPGLAQRCDEALALVEAGFVVTQVGQRELHREVAVELVEIACQRAAGPQVEAGPQAFFEDADRAAEGQALGGHLAAAHRAAALCDGLQEAVEQHQHELVRIGGVDAGLDAHLLVQAAALGAVQGVGCKGAGKHRVASRGVLCLLALSAPPRGHLRQWNQLLLLLLLLRDASCCSM